MELAKAVHLSPSPSPCLARVRALERFVMDFLTKVPGAGNIRSSYALKQLKHKTAVPLPQAERPKAATRRKRP